MVQSGRVFSKMHPDNSKASTRLCLWAQPTEPHHQKIVRIEIIKMLEIVEIGGISIFSIISIVSSKPDF